MLFVCQDERQREQFLAAADRELSGHRWHPRAPPQEHQYIGRERTLFAIEHDAHAGALDALRVPTFPQQHPRRWGVARRVALASAFASKRPPAASQRATIPAAAV